MLIASVLAATSLLIDGGTVDFATQIKPIFDARCVECHGEKKSKGRFRIDQRASVLAPAKGKPRVIAGDPAKSELYELITKPKGDDDIMPAEGEPLSAEQIALIERWIKEGATWPEAAADAAPEPKPAAEAAAVVAPAPEPAPDPIMALPQLPSDRQAAEDKAIEAIGAKGALALKVAANSNAIEANFSLLGAAVKDADVELLAGLEPHLVWLNLARTDLSDAALATIGRFTELRRLNLSNTKVTDAGIEQLKTLQHLEYLNLYGTKVSDACIAQLQALPALHSIFLWQTAITDQGAAQLAKALPSAQIDRGVYLAAEPKPVNANCPVSGKPASADVVSTYDEQTIGFCCANCKAEFDKNPAAFLEKIPELAKAVAPAPKPLNATCPISGKAVNAEITSTVDGKLVAFCCANCKGEFDKNPAAFLAKIPELQAAPAPAAPVAPPTKVDAATPPAPAPAPPAAAAPAAEAAPINAKCPVTGGAIDPKVTLTWKGKKIAFCCIDCRAQFKQDPPPYLARIPELKP